MHRALRLEAAADRSISDLVGEAVRLSLAEDAEDLDAFEMRVRVSRVASSGSDPASAP